MSEDVEMEEAEASSSEEKPVEKRVYLPGQPLNPDEELVCDPSAYHMLHPAATGAPCLSFDVVPDHLGSKRETFPQTCYLVAGTQADRANGNSVILMKVSNLVKTLKEDEDEESESESESEDEDGEKKVVSKDPKMDSVLIRHQGCINRIRCTPLNETIYTAVWSELGKVSVLNLKSQLQTVENPFAHPKKGKKGVGEPIQPVYVFTGHQSEGYAMDWSTPDPGVLATGDCKKFIHIWTPRESTWNVDQRPLIGHTDSVEDLQWSPSEKHVLASCSVDKSWPAWYRAELRGTLLDTYLRKLALSY